MNTTKPLTAAQRARKIAAAQKRIDEARALLVEVSEDFAENSWRLTFAEQTQWRGVVNILSPLERVPRPVASGQ